MTDDFILGNSTLHLRVCAITEILGKFVATAPRMLNLSQLQDSTGRSERELTRLLTALARACLLRQHPQLPDCWELLCAPDQVTLEDVFRCVIADQPERIKASAPTELPARKPQRLHHDADLLVMQAAMAINQSMFQHLRQFSLDRLKLSVTTPFPVVGVRGAAMGT